MTLNWEGGGVSQLGVFTPLEGGGVKITLLLEHPKTITDEKKHLNFLSCYFISSTNGYERFVF